MLEKEPIKSFRRKRLLALASLKGLIGTVRSVLIDPLLGNGSNSHEELCSDAAKLLWELVFDFKILQKPVFLFSLILFSYPTF